MPFYEYECSKCKFYTEVMQKISDAPLEKCPSCGKKALVKLVSAPNFRLKGGGWYETDFKGDKENRRNLAGSEADEPSKTEASSESDSSKTESTKAEPVKTDVPAISSSSKVAAKSAGSSGAGGPRSGSAGSKVAAARGSSGARGGSGRTAKPASKVAASKARPAVARGKAKPAARKKARR